MNMSYEHQIFAILFAAGEPLEDARIAEAVGLQPAAVRQLAESLAGALEETPLQLLELQGAYQLATRATYAPIIQRALVQRRSAPLSAAALEVLAIVAYNQPVTKAFVEQVRGVDSSSTVGSLVSKGLVEEAGRLELPGRPIAYRTTAGFLRSFGLRSLDDLPDVNDLLGEEVLPADEDPA